MFENVIDTLVSISEKTGIPEISASALRAKQSISNDSAANIVFVSDKFGKKELFGMVSQLCGAQIDTNVIPGGDPPVRVFIHRGSGVKITQEKVSADPSSEQFGVTFIDYGVQSKVLKDFTVEVWCGVDLNGVKSNVFDNADYLFLLTNATMSLPMKEKEWIREGMAKQFDCDRFAVVLYNSHLLNTEEDLESVCENIRLITGRISPSIAFCRTGAEAVERAQSVVGSPDDYQVRRKASAVRNSVDYAAAVVGQRMTARSIDIDRLRESVEKIENERSGIELSGKVAVENVVERLYNDLKFELVNAASEQNERIFAKISRDIRATGNLSAELTNVQQYVEGSWSKFETNVQTRIGEENRKITEELARQVEADCGRLLDMVDAPGVESFMPGTKYNIEFAQMKTYAEENKKQKNLSRGILAASIGLAVLGYPVIGISAFVGAKIYQHFYGKKPVAQDSAKEETLSEIKRGCDDIMNGIVTRTGEAVDAAKRQAKDSVISAYSEVISSLVDSISQAAAKIEASKGKLAAMEDASSALETLRQELR